jgi:hypothetical protein
MALNPGILAGTARIANPDGTITQEYRQFLIDLFNRLTTPEGWAELVSTVVVQGWNAPTGAGSRATFDMNFTTTVSNPPTQAEVTAIRNQLIVVQKRLGQLLIDQATLGLIEP